MATATEKAVWLNAAESARMIGVPGRRAILSLANRGAIRVRELPGIQKRFHREDVERLSRRGDVGPSLTQQGSAS